MAVDVDALLTEVKQLRIERDQAREECGHEKHMRKFVSEERDRFIDLLKRAEADRDRLAATVDRVRELMGRMHEFAHTTGPCGHGCSGCVTARWAHDLRAAIEGTDS